MQVKRLKYLLTASYADDNILYFNEDSGNAVFPCNKMGILSINLNNINLDDTDYDEDDSKTIFISDFWLGILNLKNTKHLKKNLIKN